MITKIFEKVNEYVLIRGDIEWYEKTVFAHSGRWGRRFESSLPDHLLEKEFQDFPPGIPFFYCFREGFGRFF